MSVSKVLNRWLNRLYKVVAILLVLSAVLISALRLMLPYAENYRLTFQNYLNDTYKINIVIGNLNAGWHKLGPSLVAENVNLLESKHASIFIDRIDFSIDFWSSIKARQFITNNFTLTGAKVFVQQGAFSSKSSNNNVATITRITDLFLTQVEHFSVKQSQIIVQTSQKKRHKLVINQLAWKNIAHRHHAQGDVVFGNLSAKNLKLQLNLTGNNQANLAGQIYLEGNNLDITPWLEKVLKIDSDQIDSSISFKSWLALKRGSAQTLQLQLGNNTINWQYQNVNHQLRLQQGDIAAQFIDGSEQFLLSSSPLNFSLDQQPWQPVVVQLSQKKSVLSAYLSSIQLQHISPLFPLFSNNKILLEQLAAAKPSGRLHNIFLQKHKDFYDLAAEFDDISFAYNRGIPGIEHLSGDLLMSAGRLRLDLKAKQGQLDFDQHFIRPMPYQYLSATVNGVFDQTGWKIGTNNLVFNSAELKLTGQAGLVLPTKSATKLSLFAQLKDINVNNVKYYFPHLLMGEDLVDYLNASLLRGKIPQATVLFNGALAQFPFTDHSGIFTVNAELADSVFKFESAWPAITKFNANLNFTNNSMLITGRSGSLSGINVAGVKAAIADLSGKQQLEINADIINASPKKIMRLMQHSPLKKTVGKTLAQVVISHPVNGQFSLSVPLRNPNETLAIGRINFNNNHVELQSPAMSFSKVNGQLEFRNDQISVKKLTVNWRDLPLTLAVNGNNTGDYYQTKIRIDANWLDRDWQKQVPNLLHVYASGPVNWQGELSLYMPKNGDFTYQFALNSKLKSVNLNLPSPYRKPVGETVNLIATTKGDLAQSTIDAKLGKQLSFYGVLDHQKASFSRAHLVLGDEKMLLPMDGFHITTKLAQVKFDQWRPFVLDIIDSIKLQAKLNTSTAPPLLPVPERIRGSIDQLELLGQKLTDVSFNLLDKRSWWLLQLNAKEARSQIKFFPDWAEQGIDVEADFLHFPVTKSDKKVAKEKQFSNEDKLFANIPPMKVHCASCSVGELDLGEVSFSVSRKQADLISLNNFVAKRGKTKLTFDGTWLHNKQGSTTQLTGQFKTASIDHELDKLGYASTIKESGGRVKYALNWEGGPQTFTLAHLNGDLTAKIGDGYLADVSDKGARIFSVLSLGSLVRKLTLDFRDIFSDGMFYTHIKGDFHLKNGVMYTDNTKMKGAAGDLVMKGNTQLTTGKLDYRMSYKPNLTSSLPVLAWISTLNPVTFLAGVALDQVLTSTVVSEFKFELTGTALEPVLREVNRKTRDVTVGRSTPPKFVDNLDHKTSQKTDYSTTTKPLHSATKYQKQPTKVDKFDG